MTTLPSTAPCHPLHPEAEAPHPKEKPARSLRDWKMAHLTPEDVDTLVDMQELDIEALLKRLLIHHLTVCRRCREVAGFLLDALAEGELDEDLDGFRIELYRSRLNAPTLWKELAANPDPSKWKELVVNDERFFRWGFAELLCQRSLDLASDSPATALAAAELAVEVGLRTFGDDDDWIQLLRGYAWAHLMQARRLSGDLPGAWDAMVKANELWIPAFKNYGDVLSYEDRFMALMMDQKD